MPKVWDCETRHWGPSQVPVVTDDAGAEIRHVCRVEFDADDGRDAGMAVVTACLTDGDGTFLVAGDEVQKVHLRRWCRVELRTR